MALSNPQHASAVPRDRFAARLPPSFRGEHLVCGPIDRAFAATGALVGAGVVAFVGLTQTTTRPARRATIPSTPPSASVHDRRASASPAWFAEGDGAARIDQTLRVT